MLLIPCPNCGPRAEEEFAYGGPARVLPRLDGKADAAAWHQAVHSGGTSATIQSEFWYHHAGCESWVTLQRNLRSHEFAETLS